MKLNINQIDLLQNLTKVENNTFWELVKLADENKRIILDMDEKEKVLSILDTTIGNLNKTLCNLCKKQLISKSTYYEDLKKYNISSHDFRFTSARDKFEEKINCGISEKEAKLQISSELNHKREEITDYYLNRTQ